MSKLFDDDYIEIDDSEFYSEDEGLKIDTSDLDETDEKEVPDEKDPEVNEEDLIEIDEDESETTEEEVEETVEEVTNEEESKSEVDLNEFSAWSSSLQERGFFPDLDENEIKDIESEDDLSDKLAKQLNITFNQWKDARNKNIVELLLKEGYISPQQVSSEDVSFSDEQIKTDIDVAKNVIQAYYKSKDLSDKEIEKLIDNTDDLEETALDLNKKNESIKSRKKEELANRIKQQEEDALARRQEFQETLKKNTYEVSEFIPGKKVRSNEKEEVFMNINPVFQKINNDLAKYGPILAYLDKYGMLEGKFDTVLKAGKSQGVSELSKVLKEKKRNTGGSTLNKSKSKIDNSGVPSIYK